MKMRNSKTFSLSHKKAVQGFTVIEVMISVLLLTFGVLALMAAQIRSVAGITEAENRSIISQAAEALAEGMQTNSMLKSKMVGGKKTFYHTYEIYTKNNAVQKVALKAGTQPNMQIGKSLSKKELAAQHISEFQYVLQSQVPNVSHISYVICADKEASDAPTMDKSGNMNAHCNGSDTTAIKVAWRMRGPNGTENNEGTVYTYMLQVAN